MPYLITSGKTIPLTKELVVGRTQTGLAVPDGEASRNHARLYPDDGGWWVEDLHSANGTLVNGRKLLGGPVQLTDGDRIGIGAVVIEYHVGNVPAPAPVKIAEHLEKGTKVGSYVIDGMLGDGVATTIYKASHGGGQVALHVVDPALVKGDEGFAKRFLGDIELAANVRHSGAVRIHRAGAIGRTAWYSTDIASGENLAHRLGSPFPPAMALDIAINLCEVLIPYGEVGLVHGDLKPRSLAMTGERTVRLMDIGLIGLNDVERQRAQARGTTRQVYYLCPQQARKGDCNARSDMYSVGCILVHMLTGRPPYIGPDFASIMAAHEQQPIPQLAESLGMPALFDEVLGDLLHKEQFFRYETTEQACKRLREVRAGFE